MPPRIPRTVVTPSRSIRGADSPRHQNICLICSSARLTRPTLRQARTSQPQHRIQARQQSTVSGASSIVLTPTTLPKPPRVELKNALLELQKHAASYVNVSRLQLALRGLEQTSGQETIRVAVLGLADGGTSLKKAKKLLRLLLADPLKAEEEWERILVEDRQGGRPILVKVGHDGSEGSIQSNRLVQEIHVSTAGLNGHKLEILVLEMDPPSEGSDGDEFAQTLLVPTMEIPTSNTGRYTPVTTPVHKSLVVAEGILGAASVVNYPLNVDREIIGTAVDLRTGTTDEKLELPFQAINIQLGMEALQSFRKSVENALIYEKSWFASGIPDVLDWIKAGTTATEGEMKEPLRKLVETLLQNTISSIKMEQGRQLSASLSEKVSSSDLTGLRKALSTWAERAHTELRDELDVAFDGRRWRKLGWWKLFWRVDDVSMIASDILNQRFLTNAEKEIIFLSGGIAEAGVLENVADASPKDWAYKTIERKVPVATLGSEPQPPKIKDLIERKDTSLTTIRPRPWPLHIPATRAYLAQETIPALQALAQKLVLQTLTTSSVASAFAGLIYVSSITTTLYEAGGVAAFGIVLSLRRMQGKWETARKFWEGEVREEGRKSVRAIEGVVGDTLQTKTTPITVDAGLEKAAEVVEKAEAALAACK